MRPDGIGNVKRADMFFPIATENERGWAGRRVYPIVPCTFAVVSGPLVSIVYSLTRPDDAKDGSFSVAQVLRGTLCLMMFLSLFVSRRLRLLEHPIIRPLTFLAVYAVLTCMLAPYPYENIVFAMKITFSAFIFAGAFHLAQSKLISEKWLIGSAWAVLLFMAIAQAVGLATGNTVASYQSDYATAGVIDSASVTAALILSTLPIFLRFFPYRRWSLAGIMIVLVCLFFTMQRTSLIAAAGVILLVLIHYLRLFQLRIPWSKCVLAILVLGVFAVIGARTQAGSDLLTRMSDLDPREGSGSGRYVFWQISLNHILKRSIGTHIIGEGMGSTRDMLERYFGLGIGNHNAWLDLTYAFGIFGLMTIVWAYFELARFANYLRSGGDSLFQGAFSAIVILFLISLGTGGFYDPGFALTYAALGFWAGQSSYWEPFYYAGRAFYRAV
jgi:hypothetical protein